MGATGNKKIDKLLAQASELIGQATEIAEKEGISLYNPIPSLDVEPRLQYYPRGLKYSEYPWYYEWDGAVRSDEENEEIAHQYAGEWVTSSVNCN